MSRGLPVKVEMTIDMLLDSLLIEWYEHFHGYRYGTGAGHRAQSSTTQDYQTPTHHDWSNGAADERADKMRLHSINEAIEVIPNEPHRWRTALEFHARNLHSGVTVWYSPVLPPTHEEREILVIEARTKFLIELRRRDLIG